MGRKPQMDCLAEDREALGAVASTGDNPEISGIETMTTTLDCTYLLL